MNKTVLTIILIVVLLGGVVAWGALSQSNNAPSDGEVPETILMEVYYDSLLHLDDVPISWGTLSIGDQTKNLTVLNVSNLTIAVNLIIISLPMYWSLTWQGNQTALLAGQSVSADITLTVPANASAGIYNWNQTVISTVV